MTYLAEKKEQQPPRKFWLHRLLWLSFLGVFFFVSYGFANYVTSQRDDVTSIVFAWEYAIPFLPWTIIPYWSIDIFYGLAFLLPKTKQDINRLALQLLTAQIICISCFLIWPLMFSFEKPVVDGLFGSLFAALAAFDQPYNQAPSLHIVLLVVLWHWFSNSVTGWQKIAVHLWSLLIGVSVLTTWQHHFIDVPTGLMVGFLCLWLWPANGGCALSSAQWLTKDVKHRKFTLIYGVASAILAILAWFVGGLGLWLAWLALALALVALNYAALGVTGFQKNPQGKLSLASNVLMAPYLLAAKFNICYWTRGQQSAHHILDNLYLGRFPTPDETRQYSTIFDLSAELNYNGFATHYVSFPVMDLTVINHRNCLKAAKLIAQYGSDPILVCCALGYSRSATAVAAWLIYRGYAKDANSAVNLVRRHRPHIVLNNLQLQELDKMIQIME